MRSLLNIDSPLSRNINTTSFPLLTPLNVLPGYSSPNFMMFIIYYPVAIWLLKHPG